MKQPRPEVRYPIGIQSFPSLREGGFLYVDKTLYIHQLVCQNGFYFLSRPRRFGKSLLLSTIEAYFSGRKDLFKGLAIESLTDDWTPQPVLHLDLNTGEFKSVENLRETLKSALDYWETLYGADSSNLPPDETSLRFKALIRRAAEVTGKKVVILIDEYDKPMLSAIDDPVLSEEYSAILKAFYSNLKSMGDHIRFAMLTGVARFGKLSVFSDLNNLLDISFLDRYAGICGITSEELHTYFQDGISSLASTLGTGREEILAELKIRYDGYHFAAMSPDVYNPFSLMSTFQNCRMGSYWFQTGTPSYLIRMLRLSGRPLSKISPVMVQASQLEAAGLSSSSIIPHLYQSGYLTIKAYDRDLDAYTLDYPNREVEEGFMTCLLEAYVPSVRDGSYGFSFPDFVSCVRRGEPQLFMEKLQSLVADVPYSEHGSREDHFQNLLYVLFTLLGFFAKVERRTSNGRIDLLITTPHYVYIFELKIDSSPEAAMRQILEKQYWLPFAQSGKTIYLIAANFDTRSGLLSGWQISEP